MELTLTSSVQYVPRVGPRMAQLLSKLGITTVEDLLYHVPFRYDDFSLIVPISRIQPGETVTISGIIHSIVNLTTKSGKRMQQAIITDDTGKLTVIWFNQPFLTRVLPIGTAVRLAGKIDWFGNKLVMSSPSYEIVLPQPQACPPERQGPALSISLHTGRLVPIYPETEGVTSKWLRNRIAEVLEKVSTQLVDYLPEPIKISYGLMDLAKAVTSVHFPKTIQQAKNARLRLEFDELLMLQTHVHILREQWQQKKVSNPMIVPIKDVEHFIASLPFELTGDQKNSIQEILDNLVSLTPMNRLLVGDVGSGKTVVAAIAICVAFCNGLQSVLMAPTQILAEQHYQTISNLLGPLGINVALVTGEGAKNGESRMKNKEQRSLPLNSPVLIGTHALLSESIRFNKLGLIVIDEQHRFGVEQRAKLSEITTQGKTPHLLTMTATPIPRTVAKILFGNLDLSMLNQMPKGRQVIKTWVVPNDKRSAAYQWISQQIDKTGGQVFIVCPFIEESESLVSVKAVKTEYETLKTIFPHHSIGLLHGRMKLKDKMTALNRFRTQKDAILLSTPVVEVGIDIPNAMIMMIEAADRFGLAQLHQLRGRVGRGSIRSFCLLFTESEDGSTLTRLKSMETIFSGPELAEVDLKLRGPGKLFGTAQHGIPELKIANFSDTELIKQTQTALKSLLSQDKSLSMFPLLRDTALKGIMKTIQQD